MGEIVEIAEAISRRDICHVALIMAASRQTFTAHDFTEFLGVAGYKFEDDLVNDWLHDLVDQGHLREIGPAVYAQPKAI